MGNCHSGHLRRKRCRAIHFQPSENIFFRCLPPVSSRFALFTHCAFLLGFSKVVSTMEYGAIRAEGRWVLTGTNFLNLSYLIIDALPSGIVVFSERTI